MQCINCKLIFKIGYRRNYCSIDCKREYDRKYYKKTSEVRLSNKKINSKKNRERNKKYVAEYLKTHPCVDCGETDIDVLEFDHISNKTKDISNMVLQCYSINNIILEIEKCLVRCANCHRRKTKRERI